MVDMATIQHIWPESVLAFLAVWMIVYGAFQPVRWWWTAFSMISYTLVGYIIWKNELTDLDATMAARFTGPIAIDELGLVLRILALLVGALFTLISSRTVR